MKTKLINLMSLLAITDMNYRILIFVLIGFLVNSTAYPYILSGKLLIQGNSEGKADQPVHDAHAKEYDGPTTFVINYTINMNDDDDTLNPSGSTVIMDTLSWTADGNEKNTQFTTPELPVTEVDVKVDAIEGYSFNSFKFSARGKPGWYPIRAAGSGRLIDRDIDGFVDLVNKSFESSARYTGDGVRYTYKTIGTIVNFRYEYPPAPALALDGEVWGDYEAPYVSTPPSPFSFFYSYSSYDIDTSKSALLPGQTSNISNYTNYYKGITGLKLDILSFTSTPSLNDFKFDIGNGVGPVGFIPLDIKPTLSESANGVNLVFPDNSVKNTWLRVTVLANERTGLAYDQVLYFGNAIGDVGVGNIGSPEIVRVNASDTSAVRQNQSPGSNSVDITNIYDINKDGRVNATDTSIVRQNQTNGSIVLFTAPVLQIPGCTDPAANNFNPTATVDDGSCQYNN